MGGIGAAVQDKARLCFGTAPSETPCLTCATGAVVYLGSHKYNLFNYCN